MLPAELYLAAGVLAALVVVYFALWYLRRSSRGFCYVTKDSGVVMHFIHAILNGVLGLWGFGWSFMIPSSPKAA